jgi:hypothetical protein
MPQRISLPVPFQSSWRLSVTGCQHASCSCTHPCHQSEASWPCPPHGAALWQKHCPSVSKDCCPQWPPRLCNNSCFQRPGSRPLASGPNLTHSLPAAPRTPRRLPRQCRMKKGALQMAPARKEAWVAKQRRVDGEPPSFSHGPRRAAAVVRSAAARAAMQCQMKQSAGAGGRQGMGAGEAPSPRSCGH